MTECFDEFDRRIGCTSNEYEVGEEMFFAGVKYVLRVKNANGYVFSEAPVPDGSGA